MKGSCRPTMVESFIMPSSPYPMTPARATTGTPWDNASTAS